MRDMPLFIEFARELRKNQTPEEKILWRYLRNRKMLGFKFLRQHPIIFPTEDGKNDFYVVDFYCHEKKLIIELDGKIHLKQIMYDKGRDSLLAELNLKVVRIKNEQINDDLKNTLEFIKGLLRG